MFVKSLPRSVVATAYLPKALLLEAFPGTAGRDELCSPRTRLRSLLLLSGGRSRPGSTLNNPTFL